MNIRLILLGTYLIISTSFGIEKYTLVWALETKSTWWENDWIKYLCKDLISQEVWDYTYEQFIDQAIIVVAANETLRAQRVCSYLQEYVQRKLRFVVIHIGDEFYKSDISFYNYSPLVIRNYWHKTYEKMPNIVFSPLGYREGFYKDGLNIVKPQKASVRKYVWSFAGQVTKSTRREMIKNMQRIPHGFTHLINSFNSSTSLSAIEYRNVLLDTAFVPCPRGWSNFESFRVYEALECGAIPIVEKSKVADYFKQLLGDYPFPVVTNWNEVDKIISFYIKNKSQLDALQLRCYYWWQEYKKVLKNKIFVHEIQKALNKECSNP